MATTKLPPIEYHDKLISPYIRGLLYGEFGTWKTVTALDCMNATSENAVATLISADDGWVSLKNHPELFDRTKIIKYLGVSQLSLITEEPLPDLYVLDTVTQMQDEYVDFLMDNVTWGGRAYREKTTPNPRSGVEAEEIPSMPDYHLSRNKLRIPIRKFFKLPCDVIILAHLREPSFIEAQKGILLRRPAMTQKLFDYIARECHFIGFCDKKSKDAVAKISFKTDPKTVAKSRIESLRDQVINAPDLAPILRKWKES